jgi:hypothetical protein
VVTRPGDHRESPVQDAPEIVTLDIGEHRIVPVLRKREPW